MTYTICHISDLHLERTFAARQGLDQVARARREGLRDALKNACALARDRSCDALTIGGDLYDDDAATVQTARFLAAIFAELEGIRVIIAPGNHDPVIERSLYRAESWPDNVHIFDEEILSPLQLEPGLMLWGLGHPNHTWTGDPLAGAPAVSSDDLNLALFHGAEQGWFQHAGSEAKHGPFRAADIKEKGFAAALCGHYHTFRADEATGLLYPGTPEPLAMDETGTHGPTIVHIGDDGSVSFEHVPLNQWHVLSVSADISSCTSLNDIEAAVLHQLQDVAAEGAPETTMCEVTLTGSLPSYVRCDVALLTARLETDTSYAALKVRNATQAHVDAGEIAGESTVRGHFARSLLERKQAAETDDEQSIIEDALDFGLRALAGESVIDDEI